MEKPSAGTTEQQGPGHLINFNNINIPKDGEEILDGETFINIAQDLAAESSNTRNN